MKCTNPRPVQLKEAIQSLRDPNRWITTINVNCGKCVYCIERRKTEWCFRMEYEARRAVTKHFVTLTYNYHNVPYDKYGNKVLVQSHLTAFMKRLRYYHEQGKDSIEAYIHGLSSKDKIRFFACGEYGSLRKRPHFHLMIFNASRRDIEAAWTMGEVHCVPAKGNAAAAYIMKYMDKGLGAISNWRVPREFTTQSEGIGLQYVDDMKEWHKRNLDVCYVSSPTGALLPMPRYFRDKIYTEEERRMQTGYITEIIEEQDALELKTLGIEGVAKEQKRKERIALAKFKNKLTQRGVD